MLSGGDAMLLSEARAQVRSMPSEGDIFRDQDVGDAIASNVDKFEIGVVPVDDRYRAEVTEWLPSRAIGGALIEPGLGKFEVDQSKIAVTGDIQELLLASGQRGNRRFSRHQFGCAESSMAQIPFVIPTLILFGEHSGNTHTIEIEPPIIGS